MSTLVAVLGPSGVGKTALVRALAEAYPFETAYEGHAGRPFQSLFKEDARYGLANQVDYLLLRAEQEWELRASARPGLIDGGLDLDFHGFTRLFHSRGLLTAEEFDLCHRLYRLLREGLPRPELIVRLRADETTVASRLAARDRINIARTEDMALFDEFLENWLESLPSGKVLNLDVSRETPDYRHSVRRVLQSLGVEQGPP